MKLLEKILYRRLDKIRKELNSYIIENIQEEYVKTDGPISPQKKSGTVMDKLLGGMYLNDQECEEYFDDESER